MTTDDIQSLRAEIEELKLQRQDLRQLKNYHQAEVLKWKEDARLANEGREKAFAETARISSLLGHWEDEAARFKEELKAGMEEKRKAEVEAVRVGKLLEEAEAGWKAEVAIFREEIQGLMDKDKVGEELAKQSVTRLQRFLEYAKTSEATLKTTKGELARSKELTTQLQSTLQEERAAHTLNSQEAAKAKNAQEEQLQKLIAQASAMRTTANNQIATLTEKVKTTEAQANEWKTKYEVMEKELVARVKALEEAEGSGNESSRKRKKPAGSASVNGTPASQTRVKKEETVDPVIPS